jgi:hypothetical protein
VLSLDVAGTSNDPDGRLRQVCSTDIS